MSRPIGARILLFTGGEHADGSKIVVPGIVTSLPNDDGKSWVTVFPGPYKDEEELQAPACELLSGPGNGKYEHGGAL